MPVPEALQSYIVALFLTLMYEQDIHGDKKPIEKSIKKFNDRGIPGLKLALKEVRSGGVEISELDLVVQEWASNCGLDVKLDAYRFFKQVLQELS